MRTRTLPAWALLTGAMLGLLTLHSAALADGTVDLDEALTPLTGDEEDGTAAPQATPGASTAGPSSGSSAAGGALRVMAAPSGGGWALPLGLGAGLASVALVGGQTLWRRRRARDVEKGPAPEPAPAGLRGILVLAQKAVDEGRYAQALSWFDCAAQLDPNAAQVQLCRGLCLAELGRQDEALAAFSTAVSLDPSDSISWFQIARTQGRLGREREALETLAPLVHAMPDLADTAFTDPAFRGLHDHPRFLQLTGRL